MANIGTFRRCKVCDESGWFGGDFMNHICKPAWECRLESWDADDWHTIYAATAEEAAENLARYEDSNGGEYSICSGYLQPTVTVRKYGSEDTERWQVYGEMVPSYRAEKQEDE